jgi:hypothetical protein
VKAKPEHINGLHNLGLNYLQAQDYEKVGGMLAETGEPGLR